MTIYCEDCKHLGRKPWWEVWRPHLFGEGAKWFEPKEGGDA